ncbi:MAG TPA: hypothetical protein VFO62_10780 [Candidatus Binatia bacterium]|nr:hypothetical protein [Candidatus Binatia bacterium]
MLIAIMVVHVLAFVWFGIIAQDRARAINQRMRLRALMTGDFAAWTAWQDRERVAVYVRFGVAIVLLVIAAVLSLAGVYR